MNNSLKMNTQFLKRIQFCNFYKYFNEKIQLIKVEIFGIKYIHTNSVYDLMQMIGLTFDKQSFEIILQNYRRFVSDYKYCKHKFKDCSENIFHIMMKERFKEYPQSCNLSYENYFKYISEIIKKCKNSNSKNNYTTAEILCINEAYAHDKTLAGYYIPDWSLIAFVHFLTHEYCPELEIYKETVY